MNATPECRYRAFISYSHQDNREKRSSSPGTRYIAWGNWLHEALETWAVPTQFVGTENRRGEVVPERLFPVFQDEKELPTDSDLGTSIRTALEQSAWLIVVCSPRAAKSVYVNEEVRYFKELGRGERILPIIIAGEPNASEGSKAGLSSDSECFVPALRYPVSTDGTLDASRRDAEPICADARWGDEKREITAADRRAAEHEMNRAKLKLIAGLLGVGFDDLVDRDHQRQLAEAKQRTRRTRRIAAVLLLLAVAALAASVVAVKQRNEATAARKEAERQARIAKHTTEFLAGMFSAIDPERAKAHEITVREVLDEAGKIVAKAFPNEPRVEIPIRENMGAIYDAIGRPDLALPHAEAALRLALSSYGTKGNDTVANSLANVAAALVHVGRSADALPKAEAALQMRQSIHTGDHPDLAASLNHVAVVLGELGRRADALPKHEAALEMRERIYKGDHPDLAASLNDTAECLRSLGRAAEALPKAEAALEMRQRMYKGDHPKVAESLNNVAADLEDLGRAADALPKYEAAWEMQERIYKRDHPAVALALNNMGSCLRALGRDEEALSKTEAALEMRQRIYKGDHPDVAASLGNLIVILMGLGRAADALPKAEAVLEMSQRIYKGDHPEVAHWQNIVAGALGSVGRSAEALPKYEAALQMRQRIYKGDHPDVAESLNCVAGALRKVGRAAEALPKAEAALEMRQRIYKGDHPAVAESLSEVGGVLARLVRFADALPKFEAALEMRQRIYEGDRPVVALSLSDTADCLRALGRAADALPKVEAALAMYERMLRKSPTSARLAMALAQAHRRMADCLTNCGRLAEATEHSRRALDMAEALMQIDATDTGAVAIRQECRIALGIDQGEAVIHDVVPDTQASRIGLLKGDVIVSYAGQRVTSCDFFLGSRDKIKGDKIALEVRRNGELLQFAVNDGRLGVQIENRVIAKPKEAVSADRVAPVGPVFGTKTSHPLATTNSSPAHTSLLTIEAIEKDLKSNPDWKNESWTARATAYRAKGRTGPDEAVVLYNQGLEASERQDYAEAIELYRRATRKDEGNLWSWNNLAWILATCPDKNLRSGSLAVQYAMKAIQACGSEYYGFAGTLAAAYAEEGDFEKAVEWGQKNLEGASPEEKEEARAYLSRFRNHLTVTDSSVPPVRELPTEEVEQSDVRATIALPH